MHNLPKTSQSFHKDVIISPCWGVIYIAKATKVNEMAQELRFEIAIIVGTSAMALFLYVVQGLA